MIPSPREHEDPGWQDYPEDLDSAWREGYETGYEDGAADVWASLHDGEEMPDGARPDH